MRQWKPVYWVLTGAALVAVFAGVASVVVWLVVKDNAYIPLAAALVSGTTTLIGVAIGALVLRFNYRSQANPLRLELFKKQTDAMVAMYEKLVVVRFQYLRLIEMQTGYKIKEGLVAELDEKLAEFKLLRHKHTLIVPQDVLRFAADFVLYVRAHAIELVRLDPKEHGKSESLGRLHSKMERAWSGFVNRCRKRIGTKELSDGIIELLGVDIDTTEEQQNPEEVIRRVLGIPNSVPMPSHIVFKHGPDERKKREEPDAKPKT